jgi:putative nucleotidyltransferase with HDIG domain
MIAIALGLPPKQVELVRKGGLLHDIGKVGVKDFILHKPATLTVAEYSDVKVHVRLGAELVEKSHSLKGLAPIIRHHHEWYDGSGYPDNLKDNDIPLEARILAVSDAIEAMASDRPYNRARTQEEVIEELQRCSGSQFDPFIVRAFIDVVRSHSEPVVINLSRAHETSQPVTPPDNLVSGFSSIG